MTKLNEDLRLVKPWRTCEPWPQHHHWSLSWYCVKLHL